MKSSFFFSFEWRIYKKRVKRTWRISYSPCLPCPFHKEMLCLRQHLNFYVLFLVLFQKKPSSCRREKLVSGFIWTSMRTRSNDHCDFRRKGQISLLTDDGKWRSQKEGSASNVSTSQDIRTSHQKTRRFCLGTHISDTRNDEGDGIV